MALQKLDNSPEWYKRVPAQGAASLIEGLGVPGSILELIGSLPQKAAGAITGRPEVFEKLAQQAQQPYHLPTVEDIQKEVTQPIFGNELLKPTNPFERGLRSFGRSVPIALATSGASIPVTLGRTAAGTLFQQGAEELGLPAPVQFFAGIAGEKGFDKVLSRAFKQGVPKQTLAKLADDAKKEFYNKEQQLGSKIKLQAEPFKKGLTDIEAQVAKDTRLSEIERKQLLRDIDQYRSDFVQEKIPASALSTRRKELNYNIANSEGPAKNYYEALAIPARSVIENEGKSHAQWYKDLKAGDAIHEAQNFKNTFIQGLTDYPKIQKVLTNPLAYGAATFGPSLFWTRDPLTSLGYATGVTAGAYAVGKPISKGLDLWGFIREGQPRELLFKASQEMIDRNYPAALRTYAKLNSKADEFQKKQTQSRKQIQNKSTSRLVPLKR